MYENFSAKDRHNSTRMCVDKFTGRKITCLLLWRFHHYSSQSCDV